jgi:hypothetical protein
MEELKSRLLAIGQNLQQLGGIKLELLKAPIKEALEAPHPDVDQIEHLLDELYDAVMWGTGMTEYEQLLGKLEKYNPEAADFYRKELHHLLTDED